MEISEKMSSETKENYKLTAYDSPCLYCKKHNTKEWLDENCPEGGCISYRCFIKSRMRQSI